MATSRSNFPSLDENPDFAAWNPQQRSPKALYLHIPFCRHRCGYCNFALVADRDYLIDRYLTALETEISWLEQSFPIDSVYLGGGTPSHLDPVQLARLRHIIDSRFSLNDAAEFTAECNPNDLTAEKAQSLKSIGVNRVSLGVQSLNPDKLLHLERDHRAEDVKNAIDQARSFARSVSIDLIFAAPNETLSQWRADLKAALLLRPDHLSAYELTYEKGTQFWNRRQRGELNEADEELRAQMYETIIVNAAAAGLFQYEVSSFAVPKHQSRHNQVYWSGHPWFAFGAGAARYIDGVRQTNHQSTLTYIKQVESNQLPITISEKLNPLESAKELLALGLRKVSGVLESEFLEMTGFQVIQILGIKSVVWQMEGLLRLQIGRWQLTARGRLLCDRIAAEILEHKVAPADGGDETV